MIRDPSDGSVREKCGCVACKDFMHASDCAVHSAPALPVGPCNCISGLPFGSTKPENVERLERSRAWIRNRKLVQSTAEVAEPVCDHLNTEGAEK